MLLDRLVNEMLFFLCDLVVDQVVFCFLLGFEHVTSLVLLLVLLLRFDWDWGIKRCVTHSQDLTIKTAKVLNCR